MEGHDRRSMKKLSKKIAQNFVKQRTLTNFAVANIPTAKPQGILHNNKYRKQLTKKAKHNKWLSYKLKRARTLRKHSRSSNANLKEPKIVKELRSRRAFEKPSVTNRKKMIKAAYVQQLRRAEQ